LLGVDEDVLTTTPVRGLEFYLLPLCVRNACSHAARSGNREVLEWLHDTGCPWNAVTASASASGGHLEVLQWAREHHCPLNLWTPAWAAATGHLEVLQWLRQHGCPWTSHTCTYAAWAGQLQVLQWVRENDATGEAWDADLVRRNARGPRKQEVLTWLDGLTAP
jgi:hypothetical protein